jgi:uncharacterized membrane protein YcaP (DUF421 family)
MCFGRPFDNLSSKSTNVNSTDIKLTDWERILFGNISPEFLLEVFLRTLIIYLALLLVVKFLGKRMSGQLTIMEMTVMVTLGAIVSVPMQMPDRGILQGLLILIVALLLHRGLNFLGLFFPKIEEVLLGEPTILVKDGILQLPEMDEVRITRQQLFSDLRTKNIYQLGKVKRVYLEPAGTLSIIESEEERPGLSIFPPNDNNIFKGRSDSDLQIQACTNCGKTIETTGQATCGNCKGTEFIKAIN